jgi:cysteine sulfinate desulfinase/cysteine desulfurase-like protein
LSLGRETTEEELDRVAEIFPRVVTKVRSLAGVLARA